MLSLHGSAAMVLVAGLVLGGLVSAAPVVAQEAKQVALPFGGPFDLQGSNGKRVTDKDLRGKPALVLFGFTHCPDVCPTSLFTVAEALKQLGPSGDDIQTVFISVDPERDTPELLATYLDAFDPRFLGLTGTQEEITAVTRAYRVHRLKVKTASSAEGYTIDHSTLTYVVDAAGNVASLIPYGATAEKIVEVLRARVLPRN